MTPQMAAPGTLRTAGEHGELTRTEAPGKGQLCLEIRQHTHYHRPPTHRNQGTGFVQSKKEQRKQKRHRENEEGGGIKGMIKRTTGGRCKRFYARNLILFFFN